MPCIGFLLEEGEEVGDRKALKSLSQHYNMVLDDDERWVRVCPKCDGLNVTDRGMISNRVYSNVNYCKSCGFQSPLFPEIKWKDAKKLAQHPPRFVPSQAPVIPERKSASRSWRSLSPKEKLNSLFYIVLIVALLIIILNGW